MHIPIADEALQRQATSDLPNIVTSDLSRDRRRELNKPDIRSYPQIQRLIIASLFWSRLGEPVRVRMRVIGASEKETDETDLHF